MSVDSLQSEARLSLSADELWWLHASWDSAIERVEGLMKDMKEAATKLDVCGKTGFEDITDDLRKRLIWLLEELQANQISTARLGHEFRNTISVFEAAKAGTEEWIDRDGQDFKDEEKVLKEDKVRAARMEREERLYGDWLYSLELEDTKQTRDAWFRWNQFEELEENGVAR